jgi:hypothetical protein
VGSDGDGASDTDEWENVDTVPEVKKWDPTLAVNAEIEYF